MLGDAPPSALGHTSPFLPNTRTQFAWDSVSLTSALACPYRYRLEIIEGWQPRGPQHAIALTFGILFHKAMEWYELAKAKGADHEEAMRTSLLTLFAHPDFLLLPTDDDILEAKADLADDDEDDGIHFRNSKVRSRYHLTRAVTWYLEHYRDEAFTTLILPSGKPAVEQSFRVELPVESPFDHPLMLAGHLDRAARFTGGDNRLYILDYKTTKSLSRQFFAAFTLSHQFSGYLHGGSIIFDQPVAGAFVDGIALLVGGAKFERRPTTRSPGQMLSYFQTVKWAAATSARCDAEDFYPQNTSACYFCQFKELCSQPPEYRQRYLKQNFHQRPAWNPLQSR